MPGTDLADGFGRIRKTMSEAEASSSGHPEDVATTVANVVLARAEQDQGPRSTAVYVHEATEVKPVRGCANSLSASPNAAIHPVELRWAGSIPAPSRLARRLDQAQEYQVV